MAHPKAYAPEQGYKYQILTRYTPNGSKWERCDYAKDTREKNYLLGEYRLAYGKEFEFKTILLPRKYHKAKPKRGSYPAS